MAENLLEELHMFAADHNHTLNTITLLDDVTALDEQLNDLLRRASTANNVSSRAEVKNKDNAAEIARIEAVYREIAELGAELGRSLDESRQLLNDSRHRLNDTIFNNAVRTCAKRIYCCVILVLLCYKCTQCYVLSCTAPGATWHQSDGRNERIAR